MKKAPEAFRTISEVSDILDTPAHVLRFWESKFYQIRPVKRAGGRRYYRPDDLALLAGIRLLLQDQGMTIRGVQKVLQEQGVRHVASLAPDASIDESFEADAYLDTDDTEAAQAPASGHLHRPQDVAPPTTAAPPPRAASPRPAAPLPLLPEEPEAEPETTPAAIPAASPPKPEHDADALAGKDGAAATPAQDDAPEPTAEAPLPTPPASEPPETERPEPERSDPGQVSSDRPPSALPMPLPDPPASEPTVATHPPVVPAPDLSDHALDLGANTERPARVLRGLPRNALAAEHDKAAMLARRIDTLLERMSDASGAGRW